MISELLNSLTFTYDHHPNKSIFPNKSVFPYKPYTLFPKYVIRFCPECIKIFRKEYIPDKTKQM